MMDEKQLNELTAEEQAWCEQNKAWVEENPTISRCYKEAREGKKGAAYALRNFISKRKEETLAIQKALEAEEKSKAENAAKKKECEKKQRQLFLPGVTEAMAAQPNALVRSSLFVPIPSDYTRKDNEKHIKKTIKKRRTYNCEELVSRRDVKIQYSGVQLTEDHADLCMELVRLQIESGREVGEFVELNRALALDRLGWGTSGRSYRRFHGCMQELAAATMFVEAFNSDGSSKYKIGVNAKELESNKNRIGATRLFRLVHDFTNTEGGEDYYFQLNDGWYTLFLNNEYALIDWNVRKKINSRLLLAKSLQRLIATSKNSPQRYQISFLMDLMQDNSRIRDFRTRLGVALDELKRIGVISEWQLGSSQKKTEQVTIWTSQQEHDVFDCDFEDK